MDDSSRTPLRDSVEEVAVSVDAESRAIVGDMLEPSVDNLSLEPLQTASEPVLPVGAPDTVRSDRGGSVPLHHHDRDDVSTGFDKTTPAAHYLLYLLAGGSHQDPSGRVPAAYG